MNPVVRAICQGRSEISSIPYVPLSHCAFAIESIWARASESSERLAKVPRIRKGSGLGSAYPAPRHVSDRSDTLGVREEPVVRRPPPWFLGMSRAFTNAISGIDRKLQGRILEALAQICSDPVKARGDTIKPLRGELDGCWRFRIGDYRLVYSADPETGNITLLAFASRGSIYDD